MRCKIFMVLFMLIGFPTFADTQQIDIAPGANVLCNASILGTTSGTVRLRANFVPEDIDLKWYDGNTRVNTASASNTCTYDTAINLPSNPTKTGYVFKGWKAVNIPGTRVEYLQSTGTQYIDTGLTTAAGTEEIKVISDVTFTNVDNSTMISNGSKMFYASPPSDGLQVYINQLGESSNRTYIFNQNIYKQIYQSTNYIIETITTRQYRSLKINNEPVSGINFVRSITDNQPIYTFGDPRYASVGSCVTIRLRNQKFYINNVLVRDFVPIKDSNSTPCMYDLVSKQCFYNTGTGDFIAGPEI